MKYLSTRGQSEPTDFAGAFAAGLAPDGGLYLPVDLPDIRDRLADWEDLSYPDLAFEFLRLFDTTHSPADLKALVDKSYSTFDHEDCAALRPLRPSLHVLELFHGPTLAFKDFGLQLLGNLFEDQITRTGEPINVLGATSGDTGAAAIHGLAGKDGVRVFILYPEGRISELQERQMTCTGAENIFPIPIKGSFDDAQRIVKSLFGDLELKKQLRLSAINSINLARILAQSVYYFHASRLLPAAQRDQVQFIVPTGNFGNVFAGWLAARMGMPAGSFQIATNQNDILHRLFTTGIYEPGRVDPSLAPSMDIQVASNFERFLYFSSDGDTDRVRESMAELQEKGRLEIPDLDRERFLSTRSDDRDIARLIAEIHAKDGYLVDPHTACAFRDVDPDRPSVILATAHPAKFPETIEEIGIETTHPRLEALRPLEQVRYSVEATDEVVAAFLRENGLVD